jgi:hypothetical protein
VQVLGLLRCKAGKTSLDTVEQADHKGTDNELTLVVISNTAICISSHLFGLEWSKVSSSFVTLGDILNEERMTEVRAAWKDSDEKTYKAGDRHTFYFVAIGNFIATGNFVATGRHISAS